MKVDFSIPMINKLTKLQLIAPPPFSGPMTLGSVSIDVLWAMEQGATGAEKMERSKFADRIIQNAGQTLEISVEEAALLKRLIGIFHGSLVLGQCWPLLDGQEPGRLSMVS